MPRIKIHKSENKIIVSVNPKLYPLQALYGAAYVFLDRAYIFLDGDPKKEVYVSLKGKKKLTKKEIRALADEFLNELLNYNLRCQISKDNRKIREYIVGAALIGASGEDTKKLIQSDRKDWQKDPLGIAVPWEEKYGKKAL
ncbi:MAG: His-Xaa-Ser system protein HxsD [Candidatus Nealsonbacteria bacterium]|nr:MAG: His-Xaa-Ser system protein HxsD [Candidatus Nealsonbacteria bacterium]